MKNNLGALLLWVSSKLDKNQSILIKKLDAVQNLFETSAEATASPADILEGQTAYNGTTLITGTMADQGAKEATLLAGQAYTIPKGYHDGSGRVEATGLASQTEGTAEAAGILSGLKAWVAGEQITGTMPDRRATTVTAAAVTQDDEYTYLSIPEEGCYSAESKVRALNSDLHAYSVEQIANNATVDIGDIIIVGITHPSGYGNSGIELSGARQIGSDYSATTAQWSIDSTLTIKIFISTSTNINVTSLPDGAYTMIRLFT